MTNEEVTKSAKEQVEAIENSSFMNHIKADKKLLEEWTTLTPEQKIAKTIRVLSIWKPWADRQLSRGFHNTAEELNAMPREK